MKLFILKILLQRRDRDEGFVLPLVIAIGLMMTLLGAVNIIGASEENLNAAAKNSSTDALAIAEVGVARYRELLDTNRVLALYNVYTNPAGDNINRWTGAGVVTGAANTYGIDSVCSADIATFADRTAWQNVILNEADAGADLNGDGDTADNVNTGQYRLVSYVYDIDGDVTNEDARQITIGGTNPWTANFSQISDDRNDDDDVAFNDTTVATYNPRGILTVQGRTDPNGAVSEVQVEIPIKINQQDMNNLAPALWIGSGNIASLGNLIIFDDPDPVRDPDTISDTNIVITSPTNAGNPGCIDPPDQNAPGGTTNRIISDPRSIPTIQPIIDAINFARTDGGNQTNTVPFDSGTEFILGRPPASPTPDRPYARQTDGSTFINYDNRTPATAAGDWDCKNIRQCRYYYDLGVTTIAQPMRTDGIAKATLYIDGVLNINADIRSKISSTYLEIYVDPDQVLNDITISSVAGDTLTIDALIHAPGSKLTITGSGNVVINGSVWVDDFINTNGATVTINPDMTSTSSVAADRSYEFYATTSTRIPRPLTSSPTDWKTQEASP